VVLHLWEGNSCRRRLSTRAALVNGCAVSGLRVLIVDGQPLVGDAMAMRLGVELGILVLGTAADDAQAVLAAKVLRPDVVLVGVLPNGVAASEMTRMLREALPSVRVVVLGLDDDPRAVCDCLSEGAHSWLSQDTSTPTLVQAINEAMLDEIHLPPRLITPVIRELQARRSDHDERRARLARLSDRERIILDCMVAGLDRDAIARRLGVSHNTVRTHTQNCYAKLGVHSSLEAVHVAFRCGIRPPVLAAAVPGDRFDGATGYVKRVRMASSSLPMRLTRTSYRID
jgi:DNA-binding NarL/FixJ family response regulator